MPPAIGVKSGGSCSTTPQPVSIHPTTQTMMFRDQVGVLASWFKGWNECEQTVALLSLLKRVSRTQARFLQLCLEHSLAECTELQVLEGEANNPGRTLQHWSPVTRLDKYPIIAPTNWRFPSVSQYL